MNSQQSFSQIILSIAKIWSLLIVVLILYCDFKMPELMENSDYLSCLYTGAKLYANERWSEIYTPYGAVSFAHQPCDIAAHQFLPHFGQNLIAEFNYSPAVAWLFSPLSHLPANYSLLIFQLLSIAALIVSVRLLLKDSSKCSSAVFFSTLFLPIPITIWIGQVDLIFGLLPFALGYYFMRQQRPVIAGFSFAFSCLKPQFIILPALLALVLLLVRRWRFSFGLLAGVLAIIALNIAVSSSELFCHWLWAVKLCEKIFTDPNSGYAKHLAVSLPGSLILLFPTNQFSWSKPLSYGLSALFGLVAICSSVRFYWTTREIQSWLVYSMVLGLLLIPLMVPSFLFYDLALFLIAALICPDTEFYRNHKSLIQPLFLLGTLGITIYLIALLTIHFTQSIYLVILFAIIFAAWARLSILSNFPPAQLSAPEKANS